MTCNYNVSNVPDLQVASQERPGSVSPENNYGQIVFNVKPDLSPLRPVVSIGNDSTSFNLDLESISRLDKFRQRTVFTFATTNNLEVYQDSVIQLAVEVRLPALISYLDILIFG